MLPNVIKPITCLCGLTLLLSAPVAVWSETLEEAWTVAIQSHQQIAAAEMNRQAAFYDLDSAKSERYPRLDLLGSFTQFDEAPRFDFGGPDTSPKLFSNDNQVTATAQLSLPIFTSGMISHGVSAAESVANVSRLQLETTMQDVKLNVARYYIQVLRTESMLAVTESNVTSLAAHNADAMKRYEVGAVPQNDYLAASVSLANAKQRELQAGNALLLARAAYNQVLGRSLTATVLLDPDIRFNAPELRQQNLDGLILLARQSRPELGTFSLRAESLRDLSAAERARNRPQLMLTGGYTMLENQFLDDDQFWTVGVALQWNLFDSGRTGGRVASLERKAMALGHQRDDLASLIALEVRQAWLNLEEAESRQLVAEAVVEQAVENLRVTQDRYRAGAGTSTEALDAEALRAQSFNNRDTARFDAVLARLQLARAVGIL